MNCKAILTTATAGAVLSVFSAVPVPEVTVSGMSQDSKGVATISYTLSAADAVVTLDIETNVTGNVWASIGGAAVSSAQGDVWKKVGIGPHTIEWDGASCWADHKIPSGGIRAVVTAWSLDNTPDYMVVDITATGGADAQRYYPAADFVPGGVTNSLYKTTTLLMRKIMAKGVMWTMGSIAESGRNAQRETTHQVTLSSNYYIGVYLVTQAQWQQVTGYNPSRFTTEGMMRPVERVSYVDIRQGKGSAQNAASNSGDQYPADPYGESFLGILRKTTGLDFDLPSEAQWEFAARAGNGEGYWGDGSIIQISSGKDESLNLLGRYLNNPQSNSSAAPDATIAPSEGGTAIVGSYAENDWGLYDVHGNLQQWCLDRFASDITELNGTVNTATPESTQRLRRSGNWHHEARVCRSANRGGLTPTERDDGTGLRVVCSAGLQ